MVSLKVPPQSKTLKTGKCKKLSPRYCGPFKILKKIGDVAYRIELPEGIRAHPVFHVSKLKRTLHPLENVVSPKVLVELIEPPTAPHEPEKVLGFRDRRTRHNVYKEALVKWTDLDEEASTWEQITMLRQKYPQFVFEDENSS